MPNVQAEKREVRHIVISHRQTPRPQEFAYLADYTLKGDQRAAMPPPDAESVMVTLAESLFADEAQYVAREMSGEMRCLREMALRQRLRRVRAPLSTDYTQRVYRRQYTDMMACWRHPTFCSDYADDTLRRLSPLPANRYQSQHFMAPVMPPMFYTTYLPR